MACGQSGAATFADHAALGFRLTAICRKCWHNGPTRTPAEWAEALGVGLDTASIMAQGRLVCSRCGARAGYFHIDNPMVR